MALFRKSLGLVAVGCTVLILLAGFVTPANASQRMVLAEEMTNTG
jgi:hypothetical protein